jgi:nucleoside 2-deoxyribosyltransferase
MKTVYLLGPKTIAADGNRKEFDAARDALRDLGMDVVCIHDLVSVRNWEAVEDGHRKMIIRKCAQIMLWADTVVTMNDWQHCDIARDEKQLALHLNFPIEPIVKLLPHLTTKAVM